MTFYVVHRADRIVYRVHKIEAPAFPENKLLLPGEQPEPFTQEQAVKAKVSEKTDQGYYGDERTIGIADRVFGPFESEDDSKAREALWVEDA